MPPRITVIGPIERLGPSQWNVLVRNVQEMRDFWQEHRIDTKIDWAGMAPPKSTVSRSELVEVCNRAGEGTVVEYEMELDVRSNGFRGVRGYDLRVVGPPAAV